MSEKKANKDGRKGEKKKQKDSEKANTSASSPPAEPKLKDLRSSSIEDGKKMILKCELVSGNPAPNIKWYKNGKELAGKNKAKSIKIKKKKQGKISELSIRKFTEADAGSYMCEAVNSLGKASTSADITMVKAATSTTPSAKTSSHVTRCSESEKNYCVNGGECFTLEVTPGTIRRLCRCPNEFTGDRCQNYVMASFYKHLGIEFMEAEELYQKRVLTITGICIALLVVGIMCVVAYCKTKKQRKKLQDRLRQSLRERNAVVKSPPHAPPENLQLVNHCVSNTWHAHVTEKEAETSLSTHTSTAVTNLSSPCWSNGKTEHVDHTVTSPLENCAHHVTPHQRGRLNATGGSHHMSSDRYVSAMTTPTCQSPVGLLSPVTPSEMSAPLSSLATSIPSMATSPSGEDERPLLFQTPPFLRDKSGSDPTQKSGRSLRNSAHYNHGLELLSPPASPPPTDEDDGEKESSRRPPHSPPHPAQRTPQTAQASPASTSRSESSASDSEDEDTPFLGSETPTGTEGLEGNRTNPTLHLSAQEQLQNRLANIIVKQDPIAV